MKQLFTILAVLLLAVAGFAQAVDPTVPDPTKNVATSTGQFTIQASALSLGTKSGSVAATDMGSTFALTNKINLKADGIFAGSGSAKAFCGGSQYFLPSGKILAKTNFDPATFAFYVEASGCVVQNLGTQTAGFLSGGGIRYDPTHTGKFSVNLIEARIARLPNVFDGTKVLLSSGIQFGW